MSEEWMTEALCAQVGGDAWFPDASIHASRAKKICATCDVAAQCLAYAISNNERWGVWGGLTPNERTRTINGTRGVA